MMNENVIKIGVPILVLGGIMAIIVATQKPIDELSSDLRIEKLDFNKYVDKYISDSIKGNPNQEALNGYNRLYDIIAAESSISITTQSGHRPLLEMQDAEDCYARAFSEYFSIFSTEANRLFSSSTWNDYELSGIKNTSQTLLARNGSRTASGSLNHYIEYVNGYYAAINLINQSGYCTNNISYSKYCNEARRYSGYPYSNCSRLKSIISDVSDNARAGWRNSIIDSVDWICGHVCHYYKTYSDFYDGDYRKAYNKITEYESTFNTAPSNELKTKLENKNAELKSCFSSENKNDEYIFYFK